MQGVTEFRRSDNEGSAIYFHISMLCYLEGDLFLIMSIECSACSLAMSVTEDRRTHEGVSGGRNVNLERRSGFVTERTSLLRLYTCFFQCLSSA